MGKDPNITRMRGLGRFFGHLWSAAKAPSGGDRVELRRDVEEDEHTDDQGRRVIVRRTTVEELEVREGD